MSFLSTSPYNLSKGSCVLQCPAGTYASSGVCKACTLIDAHALTCSAIAVLSCATPYAVYNGGCACVANQVVRVHSPFLER